LSHLPEAVPRLRTRECKVVQSVQLADVGRGAARRDALSGDVLANPPDSVMAAAKVATVPSVQVFGRKVSGPGLLWHQPRAGLLPSLPQLALLPVLAPGALSQRNAVAVAHIKEGKGVLRVNGVPLHLVEPEPLRAKVLEPVLLLGADRFNALDVRVRVRGGGFSSQVYGELNRTAGGLARSG